MREALQICTWTVGVCLNVLIISALLRGFYRQYPFVFAYSAALFLSTVVEIAARTFPKPVQETYYWTDEIILQVLVFCVVISLIDGAARQLKQGIVERRWLILGSIAICATSYLVHQSAHVNRQMTLISRDLNISAVVLDLMLWSVLLKTRSPDRLLLLLSGGLGLQLTGAIAGEQLRHLSRSLYPIGASLEVVTSLLGNYIWWRALREAPALSMSPIKKDELPREPTRY